MRIAASPKTVWSFWTDAERLCQWWGVHAEIETRPDGVFRVVMGDQGPVMSGRYVSLEPYTRLVFTFGWEGNVAGDPLAPGSTTVEVTLTPIDDDTELLLVHRDLPSTHADDHAHGWSRFVGEQLRDAAQEVRDVLPPP